MAPKKVGSTATATAATTIAATTTNNTKSEEKKGKKETNTDKTEVDTKGESDSENEDKEPKTQDTIPGLNFKKGGNKNQADDAYDFYKNYDPSKNQFDPILTPYERTSIIGVRATQLEDGAIPLVDIPEGMENVIEIAELELKMKKIPLIICREGREYWRVADLTNHNVD